MGATQSEQQCADACGKQAEPPFAHWAAAGDWLQGPYVYALYQHYQLKTDVKSGEYLRYRLWNRSSII